MEKNIYKELIQWANELDGVLTPPDIDIALRTYSKQSVYRILRELVRENEFVKIKRGIYALPNTPLSVLSSRIYPLSYISTTTVLAENAIIGSVPQKRIQAIKIGAPREFRCSIGTIQYLSISPSLYFGFTQEKNNSLRATAEKAFLDVCYYTYKGKSFSFNLTEDVNRDLLNEKRLQTYLKKYNSRFITYYNKIWS